MKSNFSLYTVEFKSSYPTILDEVYNFSELAEVDYYDRASGTIRLRFMSTASEQVVLELSDNFKQKFEAGTGERLTYKVTITA